MTDPTAVPRAESLMYIADRPPVVMARGRGMWLWDAEGKAYLDFVQGWAVNALGHSPAVVAEALRRQAERLFTPSPAFYNDRAIELADRLARVSGLDAVFFTNSGAEANEGAIKLARKWGKLHRRGAYEIVTMDRSFHGRSLAAMSASGKAAFRDLFEPKVPGFPHVPLNDIGAVRTAIHDRTVAVMLEPIQGEAGVHPAQDAYLCELRQLCDEAGLLLILDEVQTGMGRTGRMFAFEHAGVRPDILTLGKGIGGGVPLAAVVARRDVCCFEPGEQGGTYNGNPLMAAAGCAVLDELERPGFLEHVREIGAYLVNRLVELSREMKLGEVRGRGLLIALDLEAERAKAVAAAALERGLLVNAAQPATLRFMPALNVTRDECDRMLSVLRNALSVD